MSCQIFLPYSGLEAESGAVQLTAQLAHRLNGSANALFVAQSRNPLTLRDQDGFDQLKAREGFANAQAFLETFYRNQHATKAAAANAALGKALAGSPGAERISWEPPLDIFQDVSPHLQRRAWLHDLAIASFAIDPLMRDYLIEDVLLGTGRPVLFAADASPRGDDLVAVVAWKAAPPTIHAITAALPLLRSASRCCVVALDEGAFQRRLPSPTDVAAHLQKSGIKAEAHLLEPSDASGPATIETFCTNVRSDLLVMGAYSQSRLRQMVLGGFTKHFLTRRTTSVLMAA